MLLRDKGVYQPPGGLRPVYAVRAGAVWLLYDVVLGARLPPRFEVKTDGTVASWFDEQTGWTTDDLVDTGETYRS